MRLDGGGEWHELLKNVFPIPCHYYCEETDICPTYPN